VTTPAIDHMRVTATMRKTAWVWVSFTSLFLSLRALKGPGFPPARE
jgi:hypothetical protein